MGGQMLRHDNHQPATSAMTNRTRSAAEASSGANQDAAASCCSVKRTAAGGQDDARRASKPAPSGAGNRGQNGPLGIYPKSVDKLHPELASKANETRRLEARRQLYADLKSAALILRDAVPHKVHAVAKCRWTKIAGHVSLHLMDVGNGQRRAAFKGIKVCGNIWGCPVCAARISQRRRGEMNTLLAWGREKSLIPVMLTLTARHGREDRLADLLDGMKRAKQRVRQRQEWKRIPIEGTVTATEMTHGGPAWVASAFP